MLFLRSLLISCKGYGCLWLLPYLSVYNLCNCCCEKFAFINNARLSSSVVPLRSLLML